MELECVINISEGRDLDVVRAIADGAGAACLDVHSDPHHDRSVLTLAGDGRDVEDAARAVAREAVARIDITDHDGVHPFRSALDVVPFVPWTDATLDDAIAARDRFVDWATDELGIACMTYGPERTLPQLRRAAPLGTTAVGAREPLVAYNLFVDADLDTARHVASAIREPGAIRALAFQLGNEVQVSCNLVAPFSYGPGDAFDAVAAHVPVRRAELVGLLPAAVLEVVPTERWTALDLAASRTIEARLREVRQAGPRPS